MDRFVHDTSGTALTLGLLVSMLAFWQFGIWVRGWLTRHVDGEADEGAGHILSAVLGLLALLVGFTFSLALDRHESRRALVVAEANALGTAHLRMSLLEDGPALRELIRAYTAQRLEYGLNSGARQASAKAEAERIGGEIWRKTVAAVQPYRTTELATLILDPLNEAFDLAGSRAAALSSRLPISVLLTLAVYVCVSAAVVGYSVGQRNRHRLASAVLFVLLSMAIALILDLDRPRDGAIQIPQTAMAAALKSMK